MTKDHRHQRCTDVIHQRLTLKPFDNTVWMEVDIQISAGINHDRRRFDRHYELLVLAKDMNSEKLNTEKNRDE